MSEQELLKLNVIQRACDGLLTVKQAAERLRLSTRRIKQLKKGFRQQGAVSLIHGHARRTSPKALNPDLKRMILELKNSPQLVSCNFKHFHEILQNQFNIQVSYASVYRLLTDHNILSPKKRRKKKKLHPLRDRKPVEGMMLQADATSFAWLGGNEKLTLHGFIDDATGRITGLYMHKNECLLGYIEVLRQTLIHYGIPQSLYPDRYSVFFVNAKKENQCSVQEQLQGITRNLTQFGRIVDKLGIDMFPALSPQAKGRIERLWQTLQSRLPVEFALAGVTDMEQANAFLQNYILRFNDQFAVDAQDDTYKAYVPVPHTCDLDRLLSVRLTRSLSTGSTVSIKGIQFKIHQNRFPAKTEVTLLLSEKHGIRALINGEFYPIESISTIQQMRQSGLPDVLLILLDAYFYKNAKAA